MTILPHDHVGQTFTGIAGQRRFPESTYRVQFHAGFTFRDATAIVPYLREMGITHLYASPYFRARPGSTHGYDIIDHCSLNPEVGSEADFEEMLDALRENGLEHILDTVPNHVGVGTNDNVWWNDVLEYGPASGYAMYFDIAWRGSPRVELHDKVLLPLLGGSYGEVLEKGELRLSFEQGAFAISYYDRRFPLAPRTYAAILGARPDTVKSLVSEDPPTHAQWHELIEASRAADNAEAGNALKQRLATLAEENPRVRRLIEENVAIFNGAPGQPRTFDALDDLLRSQNYRLAYWLVASDEINYRRFFDINDLAALSMEREEVFDATHTLVFRLLRQGKLAGLRIDHPDGLYNPKQYFERLQRRYLSLGAGETLASESAEHPRNAGEAKAPVEGSQSAGLPVPEVPPLYVVVEKILAVNEALPPDWPVHGTSGYDFLNIANGLFVDQAGARPFTHWYQQWVDDSTPFADLVYQKKLLILETSLASELQMLAAQLDRLAQKDRRSCDLTHSALRAALREVIACFPVYRTYTTGADGVSPSDRHYTETAVDRAIGRNTQTNPVLFHFVRDTLLLNYPERATEQDRAEQRHFAGKFQQVTSPVTAKGIEDTAFYVYNRLISLNEVGGDPDHFGMSPAAVHAYLADRAVRWPHALSCLSTHDTKRSEDVRARINVLSEMPAEWAHRVSRWRELTDPHRNWIGQTPLDRNDEYLLYQTLVGVWPLETAGAEERAAVVPRVQAYMEKAMREAKVHTHWTRPNADYEQATRDFIARILDQQTGESFLHDFLPFQRRVSQYGLLNSLSQTLLRIAAPGAPDTYQGTELWDFSLVDPDNRRPVDYERRKKMLGALQTSFASAGDGREEPALAAALVDAIEDGRAKMYLTWRALTCRRDNPGLFSIGDYLPATAAGSKAAHAFGFARRHSGRYAITVIPRLLVRLAPDLQQPPKWSDTRLALPGVPVGMIFRNVLTGERLTLNEERGESELSVAQALASFPVALLLSEKRSG